MKKLMIALAVAGIAMVTNASVVQWKIHTGTTGIMYDGYKKDTLPAGTTYSAGKLSDQEMFVINAGVNSQTALVKAFTEAIAGTFDLSSYAVKAYTGYDKDSGLIGDPTTISVTTLNGETVSSNAGKIPTANGVVFYEDGQTSTDTYSYYLATVVTYGDKDYLYVSDAKGTVAGSDPSKANALQISDATSSKAFNGVYESGTASAGWYAATPEPTSGLLLLLGMAGLALKRRHA